MSLKDIMVADLKVVGADMGDQVFTWKGEDYECIPGTDGQVASLQVGGFSVDADLIINVLKERFGDDVYPVSQQKVTYKTREYRIEVVREDATDAYLRLLCVDSTRGI